MTFGLCRTCASCPGGQDRAEKGDMCKAVISERLDDGLPLSEYLFWVVLDGRLQRVTEGDLGVDKGGRPVCWPSQQIAARASE